MEGTTNTIFDWNKIINFFCIIPYYEWNEKKLKKIEKIMAKELTDREILFLFLLSQGYPIKLIAKDYEITEASIYGAILNIERKIYNSINKCNLNVSMFRKVLQDFKISKYEKVIEVNKIIEDYKKIQFRN